MTSSQNGISLAPRSFKPGAKALNDTYDTMLKSHPEAFDCLVYPAKSPEHDEILAENEPVGTLLDRDERVQEYEPPVLAKALITPRPDLAFDATASGLYESFHAASEALALLLSIPGLRRHSLVQWKEYLSPDSDDTIERVVFIADEKPIGRTLNARMLYICYPLPAMGEKPEMKPEKPERPEPCPENRPDVGIL